MQVQREVSQVRSQRNTSSGSSGFTNSTNARGNGSRTSGTRAAYAGVADSSAEDTSSRTLMVVPDIEKAPETAGRATTAKVALSTASVYPETTSSAFE